MSRNRPYMPHYRYILTYATPKPEFEDTEAEGPLMQSGFFSSAHHTWEHTNSVPSAAGGGFGGGNIGSVTGDGGSTFGGGIGGGSSAGGGTGGENAVGGGSSGPLVVGEGGYTAGGGTGGVSTAGGEYSAGGGSAGSATGEGGGYSAYDDDTKPAAAEQYQPQPGTNTVESG
ncbi:hypothetical protein AAVH_09615 [Aphelenchoides avenae]|nr:hypothetical protein AAVH_09615 [Aphelenchus avenae]